ncbi:tetratricopeptide repeat protein [Limibaculum sp. FT325]|uniref:adenylate/guanylate cyclase domain-containing protein n=1 Tax=Thermohalobaculum sediminis TaxID=2939436 RepID=UPI0020BE2675|nr:adenylate/guanylate cyclase domain-containing protein [Limibaculum sediminis]MCL5779041.1 tetratricopeptide repeat protein [Limibaculum sediminis]
MPRRLAAILAADVVGFSSLMKADETGTMEALRALRSDVFDPAIAKHGGRVVKLMGDGALAEFPAISRAVEAALGIQQRLAAADGALRLRIGITLGDVILDGDDIYGTGVNVAVRLEKLAEPGGICISSVVQDSIGRLAAEFVDAGEHAVKGLGSMRLWRWPGKASGQGGAARRSSPDKPSIAVLPFANVSGDPEQEYFADGITEDLITALGRCRWLFVIARSSAFAYKGKSIDVRQIARELGVRYILEGSVRRSGGRFRVTASLSDGSDGNRLWGERYDREIGDVFALQDEIASVIAGTIEPELESIERRPAVDGPRCDATAWDCYQRALWHLYRFSADELERAKALFEAAIARGPNFSQAYARLAYVEIQLGWYGPRTDRAARALNAIRLATKAVEIDPGDPSARLSLGRGLMLSGEMDSGIDELRAAVALDPSFAQAHFALAQALTGVDRHEEALHEIEAAIRLSPRDPHMWTFLHVRAIAHYIAGDLERADRDERAALRQPNVTFYPYTLLVAICGRAGDAERARSAIVQLRHLRPGFTCAEAIEEWHFGAHPLMTRRFLAQFATDLRSAGLPE